MGLLKLNDLHVRPIKVIAYKQQAIISMLRKGIGEAITKVQHTGARAFSELIKCIDRETRMCLLQTFNGDAVPVDHAIKQLA